MCVAQTHTNASAIMDSTMLSGLSFGVEVGTGVSSETGLDSKAGAISVLCSEAGAITKS